MSQFDFDPAGYAFGKAIGDGIRKRHNELVDAIKKSRAGGEQESPLKKLYKIKAANGVDLIAQCNHCKASLRFLPEYAGEKADCLKCKKPVILCLPDGLKTSKCLACDTKFEYLPIIEEDGSIYPEAPEFCTTCGPKFVFGVCPYCKNKFFMSRSEAWSDKPVCPVAGCNKKLKLANTSLHLSLDENGQPPNGAFFYFEKRGFFS